MPRIRHCLRQGVVFRPKMRKAKGFGYCPACGLTLDPGQDTVYLPLGPGVDKEQQRVALKGEWYEAVALEIHWECSGFRAPAAAK